MYTITTNRIRDRVAFVEGDERLVLTVDADPFGIIGDLQPVIDDLKALKNDTPDEEILRLATELGNRIFGAEQTKKLVDFYGGNEKQLFNVLSRYFSERLNRLIVDAQKKLGRKKLFRK